MRVVLDINSFLVSIPKKSNYRPVFDNFLQENFLLLITNEILTEYEEILCQKMNKEIAENILELLLTAPNIEKIEVFYKWNLIEADADDNKYADCAIAAGADYIVTNDKHFNILKQIGFPKIEVISLDEFLTLLKK